MTTKTTKKAYTRYFIHLITGDSPEALLFYKEPILEDVIEFASDHGVDASDVAVSIACHYKPVTLALGAISNVEED